MTEQTFPYSAFAVGGGISAAAFSPDGRHLLLAHENFLEVRPVEDYSRISWEAVCDCRAVRCASWSPDGSRIAACGTAGAVQVWDSFSLARPQMPGGPASEAVALVWSPDGTRIAVAAPDGSVRVLGGSGEQLRYSGHAQPVLSLAWSPDGRWLASADQHSLQVWNAEDGRWLSQIEVKRIIAAAAWSPCADTSRGTCRLALAAGRTVYLVDAPQPEGQRGADLEALSHLGLEQPGGVIALAWSHDEAFLASGDSAGMVRVWDFAGRLGLAEELNLNEFALHRSPVTALAWSPDTLVVCSADQAGNVRVWTPSKGFYVQHKMHRLA